MRAAVRDIAPCSFRQACFGFAAADSSDYPRTRDTVGYGDTVTVQHSIRVRILSRDLGPPPASFADPADVLLRTDEARERPDLDGLDLVGAADVVQRLNPLSANKISAPLYGG